MRPELAGTEILIRVLEAPAAALTPRRRGVVEDRAGSPLDAGTSKRHGQGVSTPAAMGIADPVPTSARVVSPQLVRCLALQAGMAFNSSRV